MTLPSLPYVPQKAAVLTTHFSINKLNYGFQSVILSLLALLKPGAQLLALEHPTVLNLGVSGDLRVLLEPPLTFTLPEHCSTIVDAFRRRT